MGQGFVQWKICFFLSIICLFPAASMAEPTLQETIAFINRQLSKCMPAHVDPNPAPHTRGKGHFTESLTIVLLGGGMIRLEQERLLKYGATLKEVSTQTVSLAALSADIAISPKPPSEPSWINIPCSHSNCVSYYKETERIEKRKAPRVSRYKYSGLGIPICGSEMKAAEKIRKAFIHAIKISREEDDLF